MDRCLKIVNVVKVWLQIYQQRLPGALIAAIMGFLIGNYLYKNGFINGLRRIEVGEFV